MKAFKDIATVVSKVHSNLYTVSWPGLAPQTVILNRIIWLQIRNNTNVTVSESVNKSLLKYIVFLQLF